MCGIAGIVNSGLAPSAADIEAMIEGIGYRGPDGSGRMCLEEDGVALGHRRLSILDLSEAASQPMASRNERFWIVFNGEIYNYLEIRKELQARGYLFRSHGDTEVLLCAYQEWGQACLDRCMGMYAFAIWDRETRTLFAARDRLGIKPFYYCITSQGLLFASEVKSILAVRPERLGVDTTLVDAYMELGYVPGEDTLHKGVKRLLPGYSLTWLENRVRVSPYWDLDFGKQRGEGLSECVARIGSLLEGSITLHLRSDVPLGVFLSGGIDSSAVVAMLAPRARAGLKTFSVAYDMGPAFDETPYAREVAARFSTEHHEVRVTPRQFADFIPKYVWHMDEPVTEAAAISLYYVSQLAREHVVVCLSGEGSDELFGGYDLYGYNLAIERARRVLGVDLIRGLAGLVPNNERFRKVRKYMRLAGRPIEDRYRGISSYEREDNERIYSVDFGPVAASGNASCKAFVDGLFERSTGWDPLSRMLYFDTKTWLVDDLLIKADRMSMAASIELRVPFLDHRLVEYAATVPSRYKIKGRDNKHVLKRLLRSRLPTSVVKRKKMGFPTPLEIMLRTDLYDYASDTLLSGPAMGRGYFARDAVERLLLDHRSGKAANHRKIWQLLVLEEWHRQFC